MWTAEHRRCADRRGLRYPSDMTDEDWALVAPSIPPAKRGGRPRTVDVRETITTLDQFPMTKMRITIVRGGIGLGK
jgi:transposase